MASLNLGHPPALLRQPRGLAPALLPPTTVFPYTQHQHCSRKVCTRSFSSWDAWDSDSDDVDDASLLAELAAKSQKAAAIAARTASAPQQLARKPASSPNTATAPASPRPLPSHVPFPSSENASRLLFPFNPSDSTASLHQPTRLHSVPGLQAPLKLKVRAGGTGLMGVAVPCSKSLACR